MKVAVVYESRTGHTAELAELIDGARGGVAALRDVRGLARERMRELVRRRQVAEEGS